MVVGGTRQVWNPNMSRIEQFFHRTLQLNNSFLDCGPGKGRPMAQTGSLGDLATPLIPSSILQYDMAFNYLVIVFLWLDFWSDSCNRLGTLWVAWVKQVFRSRYLYRVEELGASGNHGFSGHDSFRKGHWKMKISPSVERVCQWSQPISLGGVSTRCDWGLLVLNVASNRCSKQWRAEQLEWGLVDT